MLGFEFERALKMLLKHFPDESMRKPTIFHSVRVGTFLWQNNFSEDIQIAGLLHDVLEDTSIDQGTISHEFGSVVLDIVLANSKDMTIEKLERDLEVIKRCAHVSENALAVKMADVYDNFLFYQKEGLMNEVARCVRLAGYIQLYKKPEYSNKIFDYTNSIIQGNSNNI